MIGIMVTRGIAFLFAFYAFLLVDLRLALGLFMLGLGEVVVLGLKTMHMRQKTRSLNKQLEALGYINRGVRS